MTTRFLDGRIGSAWAVLAGALPATSKDLFGANRYNWAMALRDIDEEGSIRDVHRLNYERDFDRIWLSIPVPERIAIEVEINRRLDQLIASPNPNWGSITNI